MYCEIQEVLDMLKGDMLNTIIGDEYIEDPEEKKSKSFTIALQAIQDACAEIDGYLAKRYNVPLAKTPAVIKKIGKDIAAYNMVSRMGIDENDRDKTFLTRYNAAITYLTNVAKGIIDLGIENNSTEKSASTGFAMKTQRRLFTRETMRGW